MKATPLGAFAVAVCTLLAGSILAGAQQSGELSGVRGVPVEGHDIIAGVQITGTSHVDPRRIRDRLRANGAELRLGLPLESQTVCRFKEVLRDVLGEKGYLDATVTHDTQPTFGNPLHLTLKVTVVEGRRSEPRSRSAASMSPAERCSR